MSWAQRRPPPRPNPANNPPVQMYNPTQHSATENQWQQQQQQRQQFLYEYQDQGQTRNYWQQQPQAYPVPSHTPNANTGAQYQHDQAGYFQNYNQEQAFGNLQYNQQYDQSASFSNQVQPSTEGDAWENWGWGEEDNSNAQSAPPPQQQPPPLPPAAAHSLADSFANHESWNWSVPESRQPEPEQKVKDLFPKVGDLKKPAPDPKPNRNKLETPQWSTESQPSLESSDDIAHTSESDKSHLVSRSSTISHSPVSAHDHFGVGAEMVASSETHVENNEIVKQEVKINPLLPPPKSVLSPPLLPSPGASDDSRNPYKRNPVTLSKSSNKFRHPNTPSLQTTFTNQSVNLETLPDNSEHPDHPPSGVAKVPTRAAPLQWTQAENNEAPINDRNQYLETGQLSDVGMGEGNEADLGNDTLPPPGLQRMVPGQLEQSEPGLGGRRSDDPVGFSRMVLGENNIGQHQFDLGGPPEGLRRMVPGESSSPETSLHQQNLDENDSETELNRLSQTPNVQPPRSATIGADTPPRIPNPLPPVQPSVTNRSEVIGGGDLTPSPGNDALDVPAAKSAPSEGKSKSKSKDKIEHQENRREIVDGQNNDTNISSLTNSIRNLTVGANLTDGHTSNTSLQEHPLRRHSRQESSESDSDRKHSFRSSRDKRSMEKTKSRDERERYRYKGRDSDRYSPDNYRDKRDRRERRYRDRRYEDDTDYYSDKEKDRRARDERERDYDRKYSSLRKDKDRRRKERDSRDYRDTRDPRDTRDTRDPRDTRDTRDPRDTRDTRDPRDTRDTRDTRDSRRYYGRYEDEYGSEKRSSRPSSRSDSMHESYRERRHEPESRDRRPADRDRGRYKNRSYRDAYNPYQGYAYDPYNPYYQQYQYYENLRRTNPQAYAEWYRKYYQQAVGSTASFTGEDRGSVHSGRSSANDELAKDRYTRQSFYSQSSLANYYGQSQSLSGQYGFDSSSFNRTFDQTDTSLNYEQQQPESSQRLTPAKYSTVHMKASIVSGKLIRVLPNYPMDGQSATVELRNLDTLLDGDLEYEELKSFPGPLVKGVTHKKQVIEYCDRKIKGALYNRDIVDVDSYVLVWELLILLIRQNGMVVGTDIAELLLKNQSVQAPPRSASVLSTTSSATGDKTETVESSQQGGSENGSANSVLKEEEVTRKFREYLLYGSCKEALEWAMKHGLWGHALFLASKLDKRTYANVMMRFANGLTLNDPLQTLYQLLSGKMPAAVTCVSDEKWGDWRPHLAMILSNSTLRPDLNCKAITQLGDTLLGRGCLYAAQFCYLMAEVGFGRYDSEGTRLVLLGADHRKPFPQFVTNEAIHMTEIYEFACSLNDQGFYVKEFQFYKYVLTTRLADFGYLEKALQYLEKLACSIVAQPSGVSPALIDRICNLSDKLKFHDPLGDPDDESEFASGLETSRPDNSWLKDLKAVQLDYHSGRLPQQDTYSEQNVYEEQPDTTMQQSYSTNAQEAWQIQQQQYQYEQMQQQAWQPELPQEEHIPQLQKDVLPNQYSEQQQNYWGAQQEQVNQFGQDSMADNQLQQQNQQAPFDQPPSYYDSLNNQVEDVVSPQPQISLLHQAQSQSSRSEDQPQEGQVGKQPSPVKKLQPPMDDKQTTGWFGGIFSKLTMKPKNQMKLPDDKNPKIVWDQDKKRWVNVDEDPSDPANDFKPPPKMVDLMPKTAPGMGYGSLPFSSVDSSANCNSNMAVNNASFYVDQGPASLPAVTGPQEAAGEGSGPPKPSQPNMFKMQRARNLKNSYVNVFKQNGTTTASSGPTSLPGADNIQQAPPMNFFIPQPVHDPNAPVDFLTPGGAPLSVGEPQQN